MSGYLETWESRCYFNGVPDEVPAKLQACGRVPSYKEIAIAILKNDHQLLTLGFSRVESDLSRSVIKKQKQEQKSLQLDMFL